MPSPPDHAAARSAHSPLLDVEEPTGDGRIARGRRTRQGVAEALVALLEEGNPQPTAKEIAERAGVSLRLVFHHFDDLDALYRAVAAMQIERHWSSLRPVRTDLPLARRVGQTVRQRADIYEAVGPVRRAALRHSHRSQEIALELAHANRELRERLIATFEPELRAAGPRYRQLLETVDLLTSWEAWDRLRSIQRLGTATARRVTTGAVEAVLTSTGGTDDPEGAGKGGRAR